MYNISKISKFLNGTIAGNENLLIKGLCDIEEGKVEHVSCVIHKNYEKYLKTTKASAVIINHNFEIPDNSNKTFIKVDNPSLAFLQLLDFYNPKPKLKPKISKKSIISEKSQIGKNCCIESNVTIRDNVIIENNVTIKSGTVIDSNVFIGEGTFINTNVSINHNVMIGKKCFIESGTVVGSDGFGTINVDGKHIKIPHIGRVIIKDDVLLGSNCSIDRGTINDTVINKNTKIDNMVHVGHNVIIGKSCLICAQTGIGGSCNIGDNVMIGGKVGFIDHINVGNNSIIVAHSMVYKSIKSDSYFSGDPARNHRDRVKEDILVSKLPKISDKVAVSASAIKALRKK